MKNKIKEIVSNSIQSNLVDLQSAFLVFYEYGNTNLSHLNEHAESNLKKVLNELVNDIANNIEIYIKKKG